MNSSCLDNLVIQEEVMGGQACCFAIFPPQGPVFLDREANDQSPGKEPFESAASHSTTYSFPIQGARRELSKGIIRHIKSSDTGREESEEMILCQKIPQYGHDFLHSVAKTILQDNLFA